MRKFSIDKVKTSCALLTSLQSVIGLISVAFATSYIMRYDGNTTVTEAIEGVSMEWHCYGALGSKSLFKKAEREQRFLKRQLRGRNMYVGRLRVLGRYILSVECSSHVFVAVSVLAF
jgi:hypothetical protein